MNYETSRLIDQVANKQSTNHLTYLPFGTTLKGEGPKGFNYFLGKDSED